MFNKSKLFIAIGFLAAGLSAQATPLVDPTVPLEQRGMKQQQQAETLQLHSILIAKGRAVAIINGRQLREGDFIGDVQVVAIQRDLVTLAKDGRRWQLRMHKHSLRKTATHSGK